MLTCRDVIAELSDYLDDATTAELSRELEAHVSLCQTCDVLYDSARKTVRIVTDSRSFDLPEGLSERVLARIRERLGGNTERSDPGS